MIVRLGQRIPEGRGLVSGTARPYRRAAGGSAASGALDQPERQDGEHGRPHQQRNPRGDHVREVDLALRPRQGVCGAAGHRADQVRHPDLRAEQDGVQHAEPQHQRDPRTADQGSLAAGQAEQHGDQHDGYGHRDRQRRPADHAGHPRQFRRPGRWPARLQPGEQAGRDQGHARPGRAGTAACRAAYRSARRGRRGRRSRPRGRPWLAPRPIAIHPRAMTCGDPAAVSALAVTPSTIARNPATTARCSQVIKSDAALAVPELVVGQAVRQRGRRDQAGLFLALGR